MNVLQLFRKPYMAVLMAGLILFASCNRGEGILAEDEISAADLENLHEQIRYEFDNVDESSLKSLNSEEESELYENLKFINENGLEDLFTKYGLDQKFLEMLDFYIDFGDQSEFYELLIEGFGLESFEEAQFILNLIETYNATIDGMDIDESLLKGIDKVDWRCALAIAGAVAATAGAIGVTGGASLVIFLVNKGLATAFLIDACT